MEKVSPTPSKNLWIGVLLAAAVLERAILFFTYPPVVLNDTGGYRHLAQAILDGWKSYDGARTPGYPALMALLSSDWNVYLAQLAMGVGMSLLLFWIAWLATRRVGLAFSAGLAHSMNFGQVFFEANLMSETQATFFIVLAVAGIALWLESPHRRSIWLALGIGAVSSLAGLTRPLYAFLPFWFAFCLWLIPFFQKPRETRPLVQRLDWKALLGIAVPGFLLVGGWIGYIHYRTGVWNLTIMTGLHMTQNTGNYFEYAPEEYADLKEIYLKHRQARIDKYGTQFNTIWEAYPEMMQARNLNLSQLSQVLNRISFQLIREHPDLYLRHALEGWWTYWRPAVKWWSPQVEPALRQVISAAILLERLALFAINLAFLATSLLVLVWKQARGFFRMTPFWALIAATLWVTSILQTLPEHGDNPRFLIPMQPLIVVWMFWIALPILNVLLQKWKERRRASPRQSSPI